MLKKVISVSLIMLFLFVSFAGVFANGHKGNGEFIEEEIITQEYKAAVEAQDEVVKYIVKYSVEQTAGRISSWDPGASIDLNGSALVAGEDSEEYDSIPTCTLSAKHGNTEISKDLELVENENLFSLKKDYCDQENFNGDAVFDFTITVTKEIKTEAKAAEEEQPEIKEVYVKGYKITSGKHAGYSIMFNKKVLKCTITTTGKGTIDEKSTTVYSDAWNKLKCMQFDVYVKKTCKWGHGYLFKFDKWQHKGKYIKVKKEESVVVEESATGNEESITVEKESTTSNKESGKRKDTMISIENNDYDSNGSSSNGSNNSGDSSANDDTTAVNHTVTSNGLPKTGESASANFIFYCVGGLLLMVAGIILFRKKVINKFMR